MAGNSKMVLYLMISIFIGVVGTMKAQSTAQPGVEVGGDVLNPKMLTFEDLAKLPTVNIKVKDRNKEKHRYRGVTLYELLKLAGVTLGDQLRGENMKKYVVITAADGYQVLFSLAEIDPVFNKKMILLAFEIDGAAFPPGQGPFRLIVPDEKKPGRWVREVQSIQVVLHQ